MTCHWPCLSLMKELATNWSTLSLLALIIPLRAWMSQSRDVFARSFPWMTFSACMFNLRWWISFLSYFLLIKIDSDASNCFYISCHNYKHCWFMSLGTHSILCFRMLTSTGSLHLVWDFCLLWATDALDSIS